LDWRNQSRLFESLHSMACGQPYCH
jgi:hypothetical protein